MQSFDFNRITYRCYPIRKPKSPRSIDAIGFDTEADVSGRTFLYCLSDGKHFIPGDMPGCLFTRAYRNRHFVVYNLKYEQGAILQFLPRDRLEALYQDDIVFYDNYTIRTTGYKSLRISRGGNSVIFWDMYSFFHLPLAVAARQFTSLCKFDLDVTQFTDDYIRNNWHTIVDYCIRDARITTALFDVVKAMSNRLGIEPTTFYSIASIGYKYVREHTDYVTVKRFWQTDRKLLKLACEAYSGGKFEVTTRGKGQLYEYDINSAYPWEIANLVDISNAQVKYSRKYQPKAVYGFIKCSIWITQPLCHSVAVKRGMLNIYPIGHFSCTITKEEYDWLAAQDGVTLKIKSAAWLFVARRRYPYYRIVQDLYTVKQEAKLTKDDTMYRFSKLLLNSIYGKFVQLIPDKGWLIASTSWNPVYGAIITANVRLRMASAQQAYPSVVAVHTDSVIAGNQLPLPCGSGLGQWQLKTYGLGVILGSGCYQIADKTRLRGFQTDTSLFNILNKSPPSIPFKNILARSWRMVMAMGWGTDRINRFEEVEKRLNINFDRKRDWDRKWRTGNEALETRSYSMPHIVM